MSKQSKPSVDLYGAAVRARKAKQPGGYKGPPPRDHRPKVVLPPPKHQKRYRP